MAEPLGSPINGVLSCWFDDEPTEIAAPAVAAAPAPTQQAVHPAALTTATLQAAPVVQHNGEQASSRLQDLMEAINDRHSLPDMFMPHGGRQEAPAPRPEHEPKPHLSNQLSTRIAPAYRPSFQDLVTKVFASPESRSYQWLVQQGLDSEFDQRAVSLEQRWNTDGSFCAVRRTANGFAHTVMLKPDGSCCGERITGPTGPIAQFTATGSIVLADQTDRFSRQPARQSA
jgi:hypothetical protein